jgi:double-strand break repair protein MRE11
MARRIHPAEVPGYPPSDWVNLFVLHQDRAQRGGKASPNIIKEEYLPRFLDLVVWGHEHECIVDPQVRLLSLCSAYCS